MAPQPLRVLFIDDSADDMILLSGVLRQGGFEPSAERVETLATLSDALARSPWDIVLCDHLMSDLRSADALETCRRLAPRTPFILVSTWLDERVAAQLMLQGARDFVPKLAPDRLVPVVRRELETASLRRAPGRVEDPAK